MKKQGATLMSTMVALALSGIVGLIIIRSVGGQQEAILTVDLRGERENLIKHYRQVIIDGWDSTTKANGSPINKRTGGIAIPTSGLRLKSNDLYGGHQSDGWWKVTAPIKCSPSGDIQHSDDYTASSGLHEEKMCVVTLTVTYDPTKGPVNAKLVERKEVIYLGSRYNSQDCNSDTNPTRRDTTASGKALYHKDSKGAVISYNLKSNYAKCSQVPLINEFNDKSLSLFRSCPKVGALLGFESMKPNEAKPGAGSYRTDGANKLVTGNLACSYPASGSDWAEAMNNKRYYTLGHQVKEGNKSGANCHDPGVDRSFLRGVSRITNSGGSGGDLTCHKTLIAPRTSYSYKNNQSALSASSTYVSWTGTTPYKTYRPTTDRRRKGEPNSHRGGGGYTGHSGGVKKFTSIGDAPATIAGDRNQRLHPNSSTLLTAGIRGPPGDRGRYGQRCICGRP